MTMTSALTCKTVECDSAAAIAALVSQCVNDGTAIVDYGLAHQGLGHRPPDTHIKLIQKPAKENQGVIEHYVSDLTVRAAAGITFGQLQAVLREQKQILPIDADDDLTLGEVIAHNVYGPLRVGYGSMRDLLLGLRFIDGLGRDIHVGGRTVKNVAGYDLTRFMVGSLGEFGIVHEATIRTYALPQQVLRIHLALDVPDRIDAVLTEWLSGDAAPAYLSLHLQDDQWSARIGYLGKPNTCDRQFQALLPFLEGPEGFQLADKQACSFQEDQADRAAHRAWRRKAAAMVKVIVPPAITAALCYTLAQWAKANKINLHIDALPAHGCVFVGGELDRVMSIELDLQIMAVVTNSDGLRIWQTPLDPQSPIDPFAPDQSDWAMLRRLKQTLDPHGIFNPGRFVVLENQA
jgi:glycolate oxidase FAD binding subunit